MNPINIGLRTLERAFGCSLSYECAFLESELRRDFKTKADYFPATVMLHQLYNLAGLMCKALSENAKRELVLANGKRLFLESVNQLTKPTASGIMKSKSETEVRKAFYEGVVLGVSSTIFDEEVEQAVREFNNHLKQFDRSLNKKIGDCQDERQFNIKAC
jgi:hypothetical protein